MLRRTFAIALISCGLAHAPAHAGVIVYGDKDVLGTGDYPVEPTDGATLEGLAPGAISFGAPGVAHGFPFSPGPGDFAGTDQIYVGSVQTGFHDGYSVAAERINGPQVFTLDYASLVGPGEVVTSLTLGIAADDFQFPSFAQPFIALINGVHEVTLSAVLNTLDQGGPVVRFFTIGLDLSLLDPSDVLTLSIDQGGDGGDGWAVDFLTVGVTTAVVPEPSTFALAGLGGLALVGMVRRRRRA